MPSRLGFAGAYLDGARFYAHRESVTRNLASHGLAVSRLPQLDMHIWLGPGGEAPEAYAW